MVTQRHPGKQVPQAPQTGTSSNGTAGAQLKSSEYQKKAPVHGWAMTVLSSLTLMIVTPPAALYMWFIMCKLDGNIVAFGKLAAEKGWRGLLAEWPAPTPFALAVIFAFAAFEILLLLLLPAKIKEGPISPAGNTPLYKCNGLQAYFTSIAVFIGLWWFNIFNVALLYDHLGEIVSTLTVLSFAFCFFLYVKGHVAPSSSDCGSCGNFIMDFFWGMELYPRIGKWLDLKTFTNCRFGMMSWALLIIAYAIKQYELNGAVSDSMLVSVAIQLLYITKFFMWESGYFCSMDIMHDRAGYYICWGCMVWVPTIYTSPAMFLVKHPIHLGPLTAGLIALSGALCVWINYDSDRQRQEFRRSHGKCLIWGSKPGKIEATYVTEKGETKRSLLLTSGWWGLARHFHYVPEIMASFFWSVPALFNYVMPYFYVIYLTILLLDRAVRDDARCRDKYKAYWKQYCNQVPYKVIPGIF